jgi:glycosyltransferase involved in cell wall biosynthesis
MKRTTRGRVLMLLENSYYPRDARVRREAESLTEAGYEVTVLCPALQGQPKREMLKGVRVWRFRPAPEGRTLLGYLMEYGYALAAMLTLSIRLWLRFGFDILHAANPPDLFVLIALMYKPFGKHFIYDQHDLAPEMYRARFAGRGKAFVEAVLRAFERLSYFVADHVIVTNGSYREVAMARGRVPAERISVVRNGPDERQLGYQVQTEPLVTQRRVTTILYLGLMGVQDGVEHLIRALHHLRRDLGREDFHCLLLGCGEEQTRLEEMTKRLGLSDHVRFCGFIADPEYIPLLAAADICVDPDPSSAYNDRSTMVKIMDYMTFGKPIVAFDLRETRFSAGDAALYVTPNDDLQFAHALALLMDDPATRLKMGKSGRRRVEAELAWRYSAQSMLAAYSAVAGEPSPLTIARPSPVEQD